MNGLAHYDPYTIKVIDTNGCGPRAELTDVVVGSLDEAKKSAMWLTKGIDGIEPAKPVLLKDCTTDHLKAILANKPNLSADYRAVIESLLADAARPMGLIRRVTVFLQRRR